jgi:RNAse (barnase) inhibitor barstar
MERIKFINSPKSYFSSESFVVHLSAINSKQELFKELFDKLKLPDYFGFNWDALSDCLRDFNWIEQQRIVLVHDQVPSLDETSFRTYIRTLVYAIQDWKPGERHYFEVVFPKQAESQITRYLEKI